MNDSITFHLPCGAILSDFTFKLLISSLFMIDKTQSRLLTTFVTIVNLDGQSSLFPLEIKPTRKSGPSIVQMSGPPESP